MNKKASETLRDNLVYFILLLVFVTLMSYFIWSQTNGANFWSDYYSKEISKIMNQASPGDKVTLDVHSATKIAQRNRIPPTEFKKIFTIDNIKNEICVELAKGKQTCYFYFNEVDAINLEIKIGAPDKNILHFEIIEARE